MSVQLGEWRDGDLYIEGLKYELPKAPKQSTITNYGLPKVRQIWKRVTEYEDYDWSDGWEDRLEDNPKQLNYLLAEVDRLHNGMWIYIYGELVYLNKYMYFFCQWYLLEEGTYPQFRDSSLYYYRFVEICEKTKVCAGHTLLKARRLGATSMVLSALQLLLITTMNSNYGIVSNKGDNAKKAFSRAVKSMGNLPVFLKPTQEGNTAPKKVLSLKEQAKRITKGTKQGSAQGGLNNELSWENTDMNSYDSYALAGLLADECLAPETKIMMSDGSFKEIDLVKEGDFVMTEGSVPREVMRRFDGYDTMYTVKQKHGIDYSVNSRHRLLLERRMGGGDKLDGIFHCTSEEYFTKIPKSYKRVINRVTSKGVEFIKKDLPLEPYLLGVWLGDGDADCFRITVNTETDTPIMDYLQSYAVKSKCGISVRPFNREVKAVRVSILKDYDGIRYNRHKRILDDLNLTKNKHIPEIYLRSSIEDRLSLLAGIIDTDGSRKRGAIEIAMSREPLISQIRFLALSCGLDCSLIKYKKSNFDSHVYTIYISGELSKIPIKVKHKNFDDYVQHYKSRRNQMYVEKGNYGRYVGIQVKANDDSERQLILEDYTLTMNCGKYPTEVPVSKYLQVVIKCLKRGARIVGKLFAPTTCNPPKEGGAEYRVTWDTSDQKQADYLGQTKSSLYRIFIPAYIGFDGYILFYGKSVWDVPTPEEVELLKEVEGCPDPNIGAKQYLSNVRKELENDVEALQEEIRMNPFTAQEVFETSNERCLFNIANLNTRENELVEELSELGRNSSKDELGRRGWFRKNPAGIVHFVDDSEGLWYLDYLLPIAESNKWRLDHLNNKVPTNESFGACGLDPVFSGQATVDKGSDMCAMIHRRYNSQDEANSDKPVAMFLGRLEDEDAMYEQVYNGLIYFGIKMLGERAPIYFITYAKQHGLLNYLYGTKRSDGVEVKGIVGQANLVIKTEHARVQQMKALDCWYKIPFVRLIRDMKEFSISNRGDYDACMAWGFSLMAIDIPFKKELPTTKTRRVVQKGKITTY